MSEPAPQLRRRRKHAAAPGRLPTRCLDFTEQPSSPGTLADMVHNVHIKTVDSGIIYENALSYGVKDNGLLWVQVGADAEGSNGDASDTIFFSASYWQQYCVDPKSDDPLSLDELAFSDDDEDEDDD
ncbi:hypothetical protein [Mycolicibacterium sp. lyk4-40-TYG-92]|jgi:hypothetical protein|uniref:hypothetical protein n=1 Tax=Mycolicibacterium sp. lyk4-40-TYG-92 TaxID=3040295 RepID=UPI00254CA79A|nr:hypothetical protein [Mycolicibacterium sp. lyk4-40-TYG-92]